LHDYPESLSKLRLVIFLEMALVRNFRAALIITLALVLWCAPLRGQESSAIPAPRHVPLEVKPPDEPSSAGTPESPGPGSGTSDQNQGADQSTEGEDETPLAATAVAHPPEIVTYVVPIYPPKARAQGIEGRIRLMVIIDESGKVEDKIEVLDSIPMLDQAAIDAVHQWTFTPARDADGTAVRVQLQVPVPFSLR
jgi:periplasmic protein TonB